MWCFRKLQQMVLNSGNASDSDNIRKRKPSRRQTWHPSALKKDAKFDFSRNVLKSETVVEGSDDSWTENTSDILGKLTFYD